MTPSPPRSLGAAMAAGRRQAALDATTLALIVGATIVIGTVATITLIVLKLLGVLSTTPWWLVFAPLWMPAAASYVVLIGIPICAVGLAIIRAVIRTRRRG